jgi:hypothetical protein
MVWYVENSGKKHLSMESYAIMASTRIQKQRLRGFSPDQKAPKTIYYCGGQGCCIILSQKGGNGHEKEIMAPGVGWDYLSLREPGLGSG